ncbi:helix-turn-helix domain-containing protein [Streptomyces sp. LP11]|uniref:Helix-turn-helix domain-containing protein n=1 Tax=Streptomyces pyxinicus TaxID=2970331 RepID=A0ABT2B321_9ACTN|nr:transcriptional regulator [Streptomyces sp. LP11]MCS0602810.1 helix-turn-helix domain-containing protein [Streptomyces sp. LP11]
MSQDTFGSDFAELLGELKQRSGHSYGTLAKRLHMSTSTLHRYCNGDAVPADYAPVERLARLCRATPEELVELHRRWVLADAGRGRREPAAREKPAEPVPVPVVAPVPDVHPEPEPEPEPASASEPDDEPDPVTGPVAVTGRPARRSRTRMALLAAATVLALLGTAALVLNLPHDDGARDGKDTPAAAGGVTPGHRTPTPGPRRSAARSATPSPAAPSASGNAPSASRSAEEPPGATAGGDGPAAATPPLAVTTHPYAWEDPCSPHYLVDRDPAGVRPPPAEQDAPGWVARHGAVPAGEQYVALTVQGTGSDTVVLESLTVHPVSRRAPLAWNDFAMGYPGVGCGGSVPTRSFTVALDAMRPAVVPKSGHRDFPFKVSRNDPEVLYVTADASAYDVSWYLELAWSSGTRHGTLRVDDQGRPFRTSGANGRPGYVFQLGGKEWQPAE